MRRRGGRHHDQTWENPTAFFSTLRADSAELVRHFKLNPARTAKTAASRLGINAEILVHPVCIRKTCQSVYHSAIRKDQFPEIEENCTSCLKPFQGQNGDTFLYEFPRRTLISEVERVMAQPGIEEEAFKKRTPSEQTMHGHKIFREQWDGACWGVRGPDGQLIDESEHDVLRLNISLDWYNPNSSGRARPVSIGPLSAQIANLPNALRGRMQLNLLLAITPGELLRIYHELAGLNPPSLFLRSP